MAAGNVTLYKNFALQVEQAGHNLATDTIVCVLATATYTPVANTDALWSAVSANEAAGTGYTAGGTALTTKTVTLAAGVTTFAADPLTWAASTITAKYAVLVRRAGASLAAGDKLIAYCDLNNSGGSVSTTAGALTITWNASGLFSLN